MIESVPFGPFAQFHPAHRAGPWAVQSKTTGKLAPLPGEFCDELFSPFQGQTDGRSFRFFSAHERRAGFAADCVWFGGYRGCGLFTGLRSIDRR